ncbi:unnamed protein product [Ectocarpus sp. 12 AP-2014]
MSEDRFWETIPLADMSRSQWESLCDGCGRCCVHKLQNEFTQEIYYTSVACRLLDAQKCQCSRYHDRVSLVPDCVVLDARSIGKLSWLPATCAYRLLDEGKPLEDWHPLISGDPNSVHDAGMSVRGRVISEENVHDDDVENFIIDWIPSTRMDD